nr:alpha-protein kinase 1-like isoform X3 [Pocillopora verrucosa]
MKMLYTSLTQLHFQDNQRIKHDICNLEFSIPFQSILKHLDKKATTSDKPACVYIYGEPGCGRSSVLLDICEKSIQRKLLASKVCGLRVRKRCTLESLWNLLSEIAKERKDRETASTLTNSKVKLSKKYKVAQAFISANFQLICVDDASADGGIVWSHLSKLLNKTNIGVALVSSEQECNFPFKEEIKDWQLLSVKVKGLNVQSFTLNVRELYSSLKLNEEMISKIHCILNGNPRAVDILINVFREYNLPDKSLHCVFLSLENDGMVHEIGKDDLNPILLVLQFVFEHLTAFEKRVYSQLCHLREPLPVIHLSKEAEKLIRLGLVTNQASSLCSSKQAINLASISVAQCFQLSAAQLLDFSAEDEAPSTFELWYALLSSKLQTLIADAERNAWPFVPEKWQYSSSVGPEERYNIKDLLTAKNYTAPLLNELDIMEECLFHAMKEKRYRTVGALVFVMDRFTYWQGMSNRTLQLVEYLKTNSPDIPIAPQLLIRNVRIMKNAGNLQGICAEKALDDLLDQKAQIGKWIYQTEHDRQLVSAVCFQIKGDIQYNLGQWTRGAKHLMDSVVLFSSLPIPDTKGISSSLAILGNCLQRMSVTEYLPVCHMYGLTASHPLLQAYYCSCEAARRSQYTPLFYARHKCQAGERLLHYSKVIPCGATRKNCLIVSIQDFKDSIQAHKDLQSLKSREEFFVFVCAVYKLGLAYEELSSETGCTEQGKEILRMSMSMYEHYCHFSGMIILDDVIATLIAHCLGFLGLPQWCVDPQDDSKKALSLTVDENQCGDTVDRSCKTRESSSTRDSPEPATDVSGYSFEVTFDTVDPCVIIQHLEQETVAISNDKFLTQTINNPRHKVQAAIVWRYDYHRSEWKGEKTLAYVGDLLELEEGKEGAQRNAYMVEFVDQEDPLAGYVAKCYKKPRDIKQYQQDVICQMTARHYVTLFNQQLYLAALNVGDIQFLPVVLLQLVDVCGSVSGAVYNVEPYMAGEFVKLTNNFGFVRREDDMSDVVLAFSHFTYEESNQQLVIVDIQGWTPDTTDKAKCTFLTDPQIHSVRYQCFGTGNLSQRGIDSFWKEMHPHCNDICIKLGLSRPNITSK